MGQIIKKFRDGSCLVYDRGQFDEWCVYLTQPNGIRRPPRDTEFFVEIKELSEKYGRERVYQDYVRVYEMTGKEVSDRILEAISEIARGYDVDSLKADILFSSLYLAMIAEERKQNTRLGKRIKRLGIHALLVENRNLHDSANFMRGMNWRTIDSLCRERGF